MTAPANRPSVGGAGIFLRGAAIVTLVSLNTRLLADGRLLAIPVAALLSAVWWLNARTASQVGTGRGMIAYAAGAACGTACGVWLGGL